MTDSPETPLPTETNAPALILPPRLQPPSAAKVLKLALRQRMRRLHVVNGQPGTLGKIANTQYVIGPHGNLQKVGGQTTKDRKPTKRGARGR